MARNCGHRSKVSVTVVGGCWMVAPIAGTVVEGNAELAANPELINQDCYGRGWLMRVQPASATALEALLSPEAYSAVLASAEA